MSEVFKNTEEVQLQVEAFRGAPGPQGKPGRGIVRMESNATVGTLINVIYDDGMGEGFYVHTGKDGRTPYVDIFPMIDGSGTKVVIGNTLYGEKEFFIANGKDGKDGKDGESLTDEQIAEALGNYLEENPITDIEVDESLTQGGKAADAKAAGDAIKKTIIVSETEPESEFTRAYVKPGGTVQIPQIDDGAQNGYDTWSSQKIAQEIENIELTPGPQGPAGADGKTPEKGTDYWTEADKAAIVNDVLAALPNASGVTF